MSANDGIITIAPPNPGMHHTDVWTMSHGVLTIQWPHKIDAEELEDVKLMLDLLYHRMAKRASAPPREPAPERPS